MHCLSLYCAFRVLTLGCYSFNKLFFRNDVNSSVCKCAQNIACGNALKPPRHSVQIAHTLLCPAACIVSATVQHAANARKPLITSCPQTLPPIRPICYSLPILQL
jgi:hypothetical protein